MTYENCGQDCRDRHAVPAGYKLVPVEPTPDMLRCGSDDLLLRGVTGTLTAASECYRAMLAAAPTPEGT